jgi:tetratricopeptide (TPR) repeat protein
MTDLHLEIDQLWDYNDPAGSEDRFLEALAQVDSEADKERYLTLQTQIARTLSLRRKFEEAHEVLDQVEAPMDRGGVVEVRYLLERGRTFNSSKKPETAVPLFEKAVQIGKTLQADFYTVDALHMLGIAAPPEERPAWNKKAIEYAEGSADERARGWLGSLLNNMGWYYFLEEKNYAEALTLFEKTQVFYEVAGRDDMENIAWWSIGKTLRMLGRAQEALAVQQRLAEKESDGFIEEEIGECLLALGETKAARPYFQTAYKILSKIDWVAEDTQRIERLKSLAAG